MLDYLILQCIVLSRISYQTYARRDFCCICLQMGIKFVYLAHLALHWKYHTTEQREFYRIEYTITKMGL